MTIYAYTGVPGSGKSLDAASQVRFFLDHGRPVIANFELSQDAPVRDRSLFRHVPNSSLDPDALIEFAEVWWGDPRHVFREDGLLLVLDEMQCVWNSRNWSEKGRLAWVEFFSQHRKVGYKVIFIAQSVKMIDNQFRYLIDTEVNHRKISSFGLVGWIASLPFRGNLFLRVSYLYQSSERLGSEWYVARAKDMSMYDSYARIRGREIVSSRALSGSAPPGQLPSAASSA